MGANLGAEVMADSLKSWQDEGMTELERQLIERCRWLNYSALVHLVQLLLRRIRYRAVDIVAPISERGRNRSTGFDMQARVRSELSEDKVLIQVKAYGPVQRRFVDELRGAMAREGSHFGLIVTTDDFSQAAYDACNGAGAPVAAMSGWGLARLMVNYHLGVREEPISHRTNPKLIVDERFFEQLEELHPQGQ